MQLLHLVIASLVAAAVMGTCPYDACSCGGTTINCSFRRLAAMPALNPGSWGHVTVNLARNNFTDIPDGSLSPNLQTFESWFTPIATMGDTVLDGSNTTLVRAIIERHNLTEVPKTFATMGSQFVYIHLPWGQISDVSVLSKMSGGLTHIEMRGNNISNMTQVNAGLARHRNTLVRTWLSYNQLNEMPNTFTGFPHFLEVGVDSNKISAVPANTMARTCTTIRMRDNKLTSIPKEFEHLDKLWTLLLDGNQITSIDDYTFNPVMTNLHIENNNIETINLMQFKGGKTRLRWVQMGGNPLKYIAPGAFNQAGEMRQLGLSGNMLTRLPLALDHLNKLVMIYLNYSPDLECTCAEASLQQWYQRRGPGNLDIGGVCNNGTVTIAKFLHDLAPQCAA